MLLTFLFTKISIKWLETKFKTLRSIINNISHNNTLNNKTMKCKILEDKLCHRSLKAIIVIKFFLI
jgi:hypothetical protein